MAEINDGLLSVMLVLGSLVLLVVIFVLVKISNTLQRMQEEMAKLSNEVHPLLERVTAVSEQSETLLRELNAQKEHIEYSVMRVRDITDSLYRSYSSLYVELAPTVDSTARFLARVRRGIETFLETWRTAR